MWDIEPSKLFLVPTPPKRQVSSLNTKMPLDRTESTRSRAGAFLEASMGRSQSVRERPHSSNPTSRKEPKNSIDDYSQLSSLAALGVDVGNLSRENSKKERVNKERERKPKMDVARASGIMGFSSGRWLDKSTKETDPKKELDKALFNRMQDLLKKKRDFQKEKSKQQEAIVSFYSNILAGEPV